MSISCQICPRRFWKSLQNLRQSNLNQYIEKLNKVTMKKLSVELIMINKKFNFQWVNFDDFKVKIVCKG